MRPAARLLLLAAGLLPTWLTAPPPHAHAHAAAAQESPPPAAATAPRGDGIAITPAAPPAAAPSAPAAADGNLAGRPLRDLLDQPGVAQRLRVLAGGHQRAAAAALRQPGPPLRLAEDGRLLYAWACDAAAGCGGDGVFVAWDPPTDRLYVVLTEGGRPVLFAPPRASGWPVALSGPLNTFDAETADLIRFRPAATPSR